MEARRALRRAERDLERADSRSLARLQHRRGHRDAAKQTLTEVAADLVSVQSARVGSELRALPLDLLPTALMPSGQHERWG